MSDTQQKQLKESWKDWPRRLRASTAVRHRSLTILRK